MLSLFAWCVFFGGARAQAPLFALMASCTTGSYAEVEPWLADLDAGEYLRDSDDTSECIELAIAAAMLDDTAIEARITSLVSLNRFPSGFLRRLKCILKIFRLATKGMVANRHWLREVIHETSDLLELPLSVVNAVFSICLKKYPTWHTCLHFFCRNADQRPEATVVKFVLQGSQLADLFDVDGDADVRHWTDSDDDRSYRSSSYGDDSSYYGGGRDGDSNGSLLGHFFESCLIS
jgi:hypothetical protein